MTQAFNLSQLANNLNTSGQLDATDGLTGAVPVANGGTGQSSLSANAVLLGNGTGGVQTVAPSTSGNVLVSNGTTWVSQAPSGGGVTSLNGQTGAITNTDFQAIGSVVFAGSVSGAYYAGQTASGSNLRTPNAYTGTGGQGTYFFSQGAEGQSTFTSWALSLGGFGRQTLGNTGFQAPLGTTSLSGTWRCMGFTTYGSRYDGDGNTTNSAGIVTLFVRIS